MILLFVGKDQDLERSPICGRNRGIMGDQLDRGAKSSKCHPPFVAFCSGAEAELLWTNAPVSKKVAIPGVSL
jgi:hypothetical protein